MAVPSEIYEVWSKDSFEWRYRCWCYHQLLLLTITLWPLNKEWCFPIMVGIGWGWGVWIWKSCMRIIVYHGRPSIPDNCHNHHNRWLCKIFQSSVKFSNGYVNETALILYKMCSFTKSFKNALSLHQLCNSNFTHIYTILNRVYNFTHKL